MKLSEYLSSPAALSVGELRQRIGVRSDAQLRQWQHGYANRRPAPKTAVAIERETGGLVPRQVWYPDDWREIWPELAQQEQAGEVTSHA